MEDQAKKAAPSATATNDRELRELLNKNRARTLPDVAAEVIATERTSKSERTKQLFAMLWLEGNTKPAKTSVPRSRVYSTYASRCAEERVQPLNPASFGKLVRVIWPGIATRRLGVRGESKYHYVDLSLVNDPHENPQASRQRNMSVTSKTTEAPTLDFKYRTHHRSHRPYLLGASLANPFHSSMPRLTADTAILPTDDQSIGSPVLATPHKLQPAADSRVFTEYHAPGLDSSHSTASSYDQPFAFTTLDTAPPNKNDPIELPDIFHYAPPKTDIDAAGALVALYKTHITSLIDCVRYCKEKQFFRLFTTIQGTMTVPVHKLFVHADIAPWIRECDWLMYQKMIRCVAGLTLQVVPPVVVKFLDTVQRSLHSHISTTFHGVPYHVLEAKLEPATIFANLLHRMLKVNQAAHAAANVLESQQIRDVMWRDYVQIINPKRILESELPGCGYEATYRILTSDIRHLLEPLSPDPFTEAGTHFENSSPDVSSALGFAIMGATPSFPSSSTDSAVDRIATFLSSLPSRFPHASPRRIVDCVSLVGGALIRDMVINTAMSYNSWLITQIFVSEMALWLACLGGFLEHREAGVEAMTPALSAIENVNGTGSGSRALSRAASMNGEELGAQAQQAQSNISNNGEFPRREYAPLEYLANVANRILGDADPVDAPLLTTTEALEMQQPTLTPMSKHYHDLSAGPSFAAEVWESANVVAGLEQPKQHPAREGLEEMDVHDDSGIGMGLIDEEKMEGVRLDHFEPHPPQQQMTGGSGFTALNMQ
jgi:regulatory factor X